MQDAGSDIARVHKSQVDNAGTDGAAPLNQIVVTQEVDRVDGGEVTGFKAGQITGAVTVKSTINQIQNRIIQGNYVDRQTITNNVLVLNDADALAEILKCVAEVLGANRQTLISPPTLPGNVSQQIEEIVAAQRQVTTQGVALTASASHHLGMLAAYRRDYETALDYFRRAAQTDPEYADAYEAIAWLQQSQAHHDLVKRNYTQVTARLAEARAAAMHTDPLDAQMLALRGYIAGTSAQVADATGNQPDRDKYHAEAVRLF